jgi:competence protein ComEC
MMKSHKLRLIILGFLLLGAIFSIYVLCRENRNGILTVAFLDVGQGDAIFIEAPNGNQMLIDGGPSKAVLRELGKVMPFYDKSIDVAMASHADQDHVGGLPDVLKNYKTDLFLESGVVGGSSSYEELEKLVSDNNSEIKKILVKRGMSIDLGNGVILQILSPVSIFEGMETNNASVITRLLYGENEFLFTGDAPTNIENYLVSLESQGRTFGTGAVQGPTLASDVLKVAHHGSKNSDSSEFVSAVAPEYAVISVGKDNKYGHPNQEVLDTLNNFGAKILRTDELGRIIFKSDGINITPPR